MKEWSLVVLAYLLGLSRFFTMSAALDTGSAFEGMGAAREATYACLAEPALFLGFLAMARATGSASLSGFLGPDLALAWDGAAASLVLVGAGLFIVLLAENSRIPIDDPNTHLELTMIHEVMVLDHGGPDLALILYGAALKLWVLGALVVGLVVPVRSGVAWLDVLAATAGMVLLVYAIVGTSDHGWTSGRTLGTFAASVALLASFVVIEQRSSAPLLPWPYTASGSSRISQASQ